MGLTASWQHGCFHLVGHGFNGFFLVEGSGKQQGLEDSIR